MGSIQESAPKLPQPHLTSITDGISLLHPLSRKGKGPGMIVLLHEDQLSSSSSSSTYDPTIIKDGVPSPTLKWAEEGYVVAEIRASAFKGSKDSDPLTAAIDAIFKCTACDQKDTVGLVAYSPKLWNLASTLLKSHAEIVAAVIYADAASREELPAASSSIPVVQHLAGGDAALQLPRTKALTAHSYPSAASFAFATPDAKDFNYANEAVSHTRSLTFLKKHMDGPWFDLEAIWDEHTYYEFAVRSVPQTMATMVAEPYVNHIPTITGGIGRQPLTDFYTEHFVHGNPPDTELELISRTVGIDRVVDEFIFKFTHTCVIDWLFPGVPPTHKRAEIPFTAIVNIRGDRLYHEHIMWDQATALRQIGLLPEYLPWPKELKIDGKDESKQWEYCVPTAGADTAEKMRDKNGVRSNAMFEFKVREVQ